jgi:hypothetical protein
LSGHSRRVQCATLAAKLERKAEAASGKRKAALRRAVAKLRAIADGAKPAS